MRALGACGLIQVLGRCLLTFFFLHGTIQPSDLFGCALRRAHLWCLAIHGYGGTAGVAPGAPTGARRGLAEEQRMHV